MSVTLPCLRKNCAALSVIALKKMISARLQQVCRTLTWCHLKRCFYFFFSKVRCPRLCLFESVFAFFLTEPNIFIRFIASKTHSRFFAGKVCSFTVIG